MVASPSLTAPTHHVLLVDDNPAERTIMRDALGLVSPHLALHEVENAVQAFWFLAKQREYRERPTPHLVLLDLTMPVIDGKRVLEVIRRDPLWRHLRVLVLTTSNRDLDLAACHDLGADGFITKPALWQGYLALGRLLHEFIARGHATPPMPGVRAHFFARARAHAG